jgi:hypothetical protein
MYPISARARISGGPQAAPRASCVEVLKVSDDPRKARGAL